MGCSLCPTSSKPSPHSNNRCFILYIHVVLKFITQSNVCKQDNSFDPKTILVYKNHGRYVCIAMLSMVDLLPWDPNISHLNQTTTDIIAVACWILNILYPLQSDV